MSMGSKKQEVAPAQTTTQTQSMPGWQEDHLKNNILPEYQRQYEEGGPGYFSTYTGPDVATQNALSMMESRATGGNPLTGEAQSTASMFMNPEMMRAESNPYLGSYMDVANERTANQLSDVLSKTNGAFMAGGRGQRYDGTGAGPSNNARGAEMARIYGEGADAIANANTGIAYRNYGDAQGRAMQAMGAAPGLAQADYFDIGKLGAVGAAREGIDQASLMDQAAEFYYPQQQEQALLDRYMGAARGNYGMTTTQQTPAQYGYSNPFAGAAGGAMAGASMFGPWGALGGGALGLLGSM